MNTEDSNRASVREAINIYMKFAIKPRMKAFVSMLNEFYLPKWGEDLFFDFEDPAPTDVEENIRIITSVPMSVNEKRVLFGLDPVDGGDEVHIIDPTEQFSEDDDSEDDQEDEDQDNNQRSYIKTLKTKPAKRKFILSPRPKSTLEAKRDELITQIESAGDNENKLRREIKELYSKKRAIAFEKKESTLDIKDEYHEFTKDQKDTVWKVFDEELNIWEDKFRYRLGKYLNGQQKRITDNISGQKSLREATKMINFNLPREKVVFVAQLKDFYERIIKQQGTQALNFLGVANNTIDLDDPEVQRFLNHGAFKYVNSINEQTREELVTALSEGIKEGESIPQLQTRIEKVYQDVKGARAKTITRTETLRTVTFATLNGYKQSGVVQGKEWLSARDGRVRHSHQPGIGVDGEVRKLNEKFSNGVSAPGYDGPPEETINCRCTLLPVLIKGKSFKMPDASFLDEVKENTIKQENKENERKELEESVKKTVKEEINQFKNDLIKELE